MKMSDVNGSSLLKAAIITMVTGKDEPDFMIFPVLLSVLLTAVSVMRRKRKKSKRQMKNNLGNIHVPPFAHV